MSKIKKVCHDCGSEDVHRDAWAEWDFETQEWVLSDVYDDAYCNTCETDTKLPSVPVPEE